MSRSSSGAGKTSAAKSRPKAAVAAASAAKTTDKVAGASSEAVKKATGKGWDEWLKTLDKAGAIELTHKEIARLLHQEHGVSEWWAQSITVGYEQARGLREKHQKADGFDISASKTINVPIGGVFGAWNDEKTRRKWLGDVALTVRKATKDKSIRITWDQGAEKGTSVEGYFTSKGESKTSLSVQHRKLKTAAAGEKMKKYWGEKLEALKAMLEG